jgi:hypothetical protein
MKGPLSKLQHIVTLWKSSISCARIIKIHLLGLQFSSKYKLTEIRTLAIVTAVGKTQLIIIGLSVCNVDFRNPVIDMVL